MTDHHIIWTSRITLTGTDGADILRGSKDWDYLYGYEGNDRLYGGAGDDELHGGAGNGASGGPKHIIENMRPADGAGVRCCNIRPGVRDTAERWGQCRFSL